MTWTGVFGTHRLPGFGVIAVPGYGAVPFAGQRQAGR